MEFGDLTCRGCRSRIPRRPGRGGQPWFCDVCRPERKRKYERSKQTGAAQRKQKKKNKLYAERIEREQGRKVGERLPKPVRYCVWTECSREIGANGARGFCGIHYREMRWILGEIEINRGSYRDRAEMYGVPWEKFTREAVFERDGWVCGICGDPVSPTATGPMKVSLDHIIPMSKGGGHTWDNVQCAHLRCNSIKRDKLPFESKVVA